MKIWKLSCLAVVLCWSRLGLVASLLPVKNVLKILPDILGPPATHFSPTTKFTVSTELTTTAGTKESLLFTDHYFSVSVTVCVIQVIMRKYVIVLMLLLSVSSRSDTQWMDQGDPPVNTGPFHNHDVEHQHHKPRPDINPEPPDLHPVQHAGIPRDLQVYPLPLQGSDHELMLNVTWKSPLDFPARDYSLEIRSVTDTVDCNTPMCYEYNIPGDAQWWLVPAYASPVAESCAVRPSCTYDVLLTAHPWDGHTVAEMLVQMDECVAGVCSCAHSPRLPVPKVSATTVVVHGEILVNVSWTLPQPEFPQRLPKNLNKQSYAISIGKQMVTDAHPAPWFSNTMIRHVAADGSVASGDSSRWLLVPTTERGSDASEVRSGEQKGERSGKRHKIELDVKLLARVNLIDDRGCVGPAGNATAYDPVIAHKVQFGTYVLWAIIGGLCVLAMVAVFAMSSRVVKRILSALRPAAVSTPLTPLRQRPAWLNLQLRS